MNHLDCPLTQLQFLAFDLETTGLNVAEDRIVEIGASRFTLGQEILQGQRETYAQVLNPHLQMSEEVIAVHHIPQQAVDRAPDFEQIYEQFEQFSQDTVFLAHHAAFDMAFLRAELHRMGKSLPPLFVIDTFPLAKACFPEEASYALGRLVDALGLTMEGDAHRALPDAIACQKLFLACILRQQLQEETLASFYARFPRVRLSTQAETQHSELWKCLEKALENHQDISIFYTNSRKKKKERRIRPLFLGGSGEYAYVDAFCHFRQSQRRFYLNRISNCKTEIKSG